MHIGMAVAAVEEVVDAIVDTFMAFVQWAIESIGDVVDALLGPVIQVMDDAKKVFHKTMCLATQQAREDLAGAGEVASGTLQSVAKALFGDYFFILLTIASIASIALTILKIVTTVFGFLISTVVCMIAGVLFQHAVDSISFSSCESGIQDDTRSGVMGWLGASPEGSSESDSDLEEGMSVFDGCWGVFEIIPEMAILESCRTLKNVRNLALSIMVTSLAFINLAIGDVTLEVLTLALSELLWLESFWEFITSGAMDKELSILAIIVSFVGVTTSLGAMFLE